MEESGGTYFVPYAKRATPSRLALGNTPARELTFHMNIGILTIWRSLVTSAWAMLQLPPGHHFLRACPDELLNWFVQFQLPGVADGLTFLATSAAFFVFSERCSWVKWLALVPTRGWETRRRPLSTSAYSLKGILRVGDGRGLKVIVKCTIFLACSSTFYTPSKILDFVSISSFNQASHNIQIHDFISL